MLGYRNSSIFVTQKGVVIEEATGTFGLARMIEELQSLLPNHSLDLLIPVICHASTKLGYGVLDILANSHQRIKRQTETKLIALEIALVRAEYFALLQNWLEQYLPPHIDEFIISGGTSLYLKPELTSFFQPFNSSINWCNNLEKAILITFGELVSHYSLESRLADVYGLFCKQLNRHPLPKFPQTFEDLNKKNVQKRAS